MERIGRPTNGFLVAGRCDVFIPLFKDDRSGYYVLFLVQDTPTDIKRILHNESGRRPLIIATLSHTSGYPDDLGYRQNGQGSAHDM